MASNVIVTELSGADQEIRAANKLINYYGYTIAETGGSAAATVYIRSASDTGTILDVIELAAGESKEAWYGPQGIRSAGLFVDVSAGAVEGSVRHG